MANGSGSFCEGSPKTTLQPTHPGRGTHRGVRLGVFGLVLAGVLMFTGCGSDDNSAESQAADSSAPASAPATPADGGASDAAAAPLDAAGSAQLAQLCAAVNVDEIMQSSDFAQQAATSLSTMSPEGADAAVVGWLQSTAGYFSTLSVQLAPVFAALGQQTGEATWNEVVTSLATAAENLEGLAADVESGGFNEDDQGRIEAALDLPGLNTNPFDNPTWQETVTSIPECAKFGDEMDVLLAPSE